jgi:hypothetical protein
MRPLVTALRGMLLAITVASLSWATTGPAGAQDGDGAFNTLLAQYVKASVDGVNRVDYAAWVKSRADRDALDRYIAAQAAVQPSAMPRARAMAFWINIYNAITLKVVLDKYPVASIRDIKSDGVWLDPKAFSGPWVAKRITIEGRNLSLDQIEHDILRPTFKDPRVHYAVNCASYGCPNLQMKAWRAETLDSDLDAAARAYVNHSRGVTISGQRLKVSSIYAWFKSDFGGTDTGVIAHLKKYASPELLRQLGTVTTIDGDSYDWSLNDMARAKK